MPRVARLIHAGGVHHVISRFVDRSWLFQDAEERTKYLNFLGRSLHRSDWRCLAYCLMSNHVHLAFVAGDEPLASWAHRAHSPFAQWMNKRRGRLGPVFADRPAAHHVPPHRVAEVLAYVHNNPVRAGVVASAAASAWSSHGVYVGRLPARRWLHVDEGLALAGSGGRPDEFDAFVTSRTTIIELPNMGAVRSAARRRGPVEVGTPTLVDPVLVPIVARPSAALRPEVADVLRAARARFAVGMATLRRPYARGAARRAVIHAAVQLGIPLSDAASALGVTRQRASTVAARRLSDEEQRAVDEVVRAVTKG